MNARMRTHCGGCDSDELEVFLNLGETPLANKYPGSREEEEQEVFYPLQLSVCAKCSLVQQQCVVADHVLFADDYGFYSSTSPAKRLHHRRVATRLLSNYEDLAKKFTVEIGSNDGDLLLLLKEAGCQVLGVDPAAGPSELAASQGLDVHIEPFSYLKAWHIRSTHGPAGLVIANHVAAHVSDPSDFFAGIAHLLADDGVAVIEVQYLGDLIAGNQFDYVYHEHRFHFSLTSLAAVAVRRGLFVNDVVHLSSVQSGTLSVHLSKRSFMTERAREMLDSERWLTDMSTYAAMQGRVDYVAELLCDLVEQERHAGRRVAGYAAPAKATTLLNYASIGTDYLEYVTDTTPWKVGRSIPGVHVPIVDRADPKLELPDTFLVLAANYFPAILRSEPELQRWLVPLPVPVWFHYQHR
jgi:hypothetical protein